MMQASDGDFYQNLIDSLGRHDPDEQPSAECEARRRQTARYELTIAMDNIRGRLTRLEALAASIEHPKAIAIRRALKALGQQSP
jgi:hypothetical protein